MSKTTWPSIRLTPSSLRAGTDIETGLRPFIAERNRSLQSESIEKFGADKNILENYLRVLPLTSLMCVINSIIHWLIRYMLCNFSLHFNEISNESCSECFAWQRRQRISLGHFELKTWFTSAGFTKDANSEGINSWPTDNLPWATCIRGLLRDL